MAGRTKRRRAAAALRQREGQNQGAVKADPRGSLFALRATHGIATVLRMQAVRELSRQQGNQFVQRSLAGGHGESGANNGGGLLAREPEKGEEEGPVKATITSKDANYGVSGTTLKQAFDSIQTYAKNHDGEAGAVKWKPKWSFKLDSDGAVDKVILDVTITKTMPNWPNASKLSDAAKAEWERAYAELDKHENEHVSILTREAGTLGNFAVGAKPADAHKAMQEAVASANAANTSIDPFETVLTTDIK
jgi:predicted secreted Zn-dependent protease